MCVFNIYKVFFYTMFRLKVVLLRNTYRKLIRIKKISMKKTQIKFLAAVASSMIAFSASAAEPCKAYVKIDAGYGVASGTRFNGDVKELQKNTLAADSQIAGMGDLHGMIGSAGVGYAFNDAMRGEVSFDFSPKMKYKGPAFVIETREFGGSAKLFYDFNNNTLVTPFVFGGLGMQNIKPTIKADPKSANLDTEVVKLAQLDGEDFKKAAENNVALYDSLNMKSRNVMKYQGGFGLGVKVSDMISVDFTYGLGSNLKYTVVENAGAVILNKADLPSSPSSIGVDKIKEPRLFKSATFKNSLFQSLTLGLRFTI